LLIDGTITEQWSTKIIHIYRRVYRRGEKTYLKVVLLQPLWTYAARLNTFSSTLLQFFCFQLDDFVTGSLAHRLFIECRT